MIGAFQKSSKYAVYLRGVFARQGVKEKDSVSNMFPYRVCGMLSRDTMGFEDELIPCIPDKVHGSRIDGVGDLLLCTGGPITCQG